MAANPREATRLSYDQEQRLLLIDWQDGHQSAYPYIWLRHEQFFPLMGCPEQQQDSEFRLPEDPASLSIESTSVEQETLIIKWAHDNSSTRHSLSGLRDQCLSNEARRQRHPKPVQWDANRAQEFPWFDGSDFEHPERRLELLLQLRDYGIALVRNLPVENGTVANIAAYLGALRNTQLPLGTVYLIRPGPPVEYL